MAVILGVVLVVMAVMNGAMFYVLRTAAFSAKRQVEACFVRELEDYNGFLEEKQKENKKIKEEKGRLQEEIREMEGVVTSLKSSPFYAPRAIQRELFIPTARYIDNEFFDNHKIVNDMMRDLDQRAIVRDIREKHAYKGNRQEYDVACAILSLLGMDATYELCTVSANMQLSVLRGMFSGQDEGEMLDRYISTLPEEEDFDVLGFRTFVREIRTLQDPTVYVRTGHKEPGDVEEEEGLVHQHDENISEGLKIIYQNQSYDFSIYRLRSRK